MCSSTNFPTRLCLLILSFRLFFLLTLARCKSSLVGSFSFFFRPKKWPPEFFIISIDTCVALAKKTRLATMADDHRGMQRVRK